MASFTKLEQEDDLAPMGGISEKDQTVLESEKVHTYQAEVLGQIKLAFPVCCTFVMRKSVDIVSVMFVGRLGSHYLSAAGIAAVTSNVSGNSMIVGLAGALSTICSQAFGSKDMISFNIAPQRAVLILLAVVCVPISVLWWFSSPVMVALGQVRKHYNYN